MDITVGTFNLNNLFSRYNFGAEVRAIEAGETGITTELNYVFVDPLTYRVRTDSSGRLIRSKPETDSQTIASRIKQISVDVLAVQEVEDIGTLRAFNTSYLDSLYPHQVLVEGNDPRFIDLGLLSKYPIGGITSWQQAYHHEDPHGPIFSRDFLEVVILNNRGKKLFTLFNTHLKSHYVPWWEQDQETARRKNDMRRRRQAEKAAEIVEAQTRPDSRFVVLGDFNDPPDSEALAPLVASPGLGLVNALTNPQETNPPKAERLPSVTPTFTAWTHRFKTSGQPAEHNLYDQIWLSPALADRAQEAWIERRQDSVEGDGSDHDPAWVKLRL